MTRTRLPGTPDPDTYFEGADGNRIAADVWGEPGHQLVLLLHGGGQTRHAWKGAGEALSEQGYHAIALDARGHGDSDWIASGEYDHQDMVRDLAAVAKSISSAPPVLVGASMGGMVSLSGLGSGHLTARALVLVDIGPRIEVEGANKVREFMQQKIEGFDSLEEVADAIANYQPQRQRPRKLDGLAKNVRQGEDGRYYWHWDPNYITRKMEVNSRMEEMQAASRSLTIPTLLVRGGLSDVLSEEGAQEFLTLCPHAEYSNVTDAAHMVAGDRNDIFVADVADFLGRVVPQEK